MELINIIAAAIGAWAFGSLWYMKLAKQWMAVSGVPVGEDGNPKNSSTPTPYVISFVAILVVAGMMRHMFGMAGIDSVGKGLLSGLGVGAFFISPWILINNTYTMRPLNLTLIDGGYATFGCGIMSLILTLF
ncbi:MAG: DUF1761 family protein [Boseongicola sp.]|nr:MAG: DUF1761 family protein [Boseongicola sp.]